MEGPNHIREEVGLDQNFILVRSFKHESYRNRRQKLSQG